jgi:hypothetical protein
MAQIIAHYFPRDFDVKSMLLEHLDQDSCIHVAQQKDKIIGFSVNSCGYQKTPFYKEEIPLFYQRLLYVDPAAQHKAIGLGLQTAGLRYQLGPCWLFRRFAVICLTSNPQVLRAIHQYNEYFPRQDDELTQEVYAFCQQLGPTMGYSRVDRRLLVYGTNETTLEGEDYTSQWMNFLLSGHAKYDQMILDRVFTTRNGRIFHTGALLVAIGYAKPMHFIRRFLEIRFRYHH